MKDVCVVCPFFRTATKSKIYCQGAVEGTKSTTLFFDTSNQKERHLNNFCSSYCWEGCTVAQSIRDRDDIENIITNESSSN